MPRVGCRRWCRASSRPSRRARASGCWASPPTEISSPTSAPASWLTSGDRTFRIETHTAGSTPQLTVAASLVSPVSAPLTESTVFGLPLTAAHQRPTGWASRVAVVPLTEADSYGSVLYDLLSVSAGSRTDEAWVGVSAADGESYIPDGSPADQPNGGRTGNESSIASVTVAARYRGRPEFAIPPPVGEIPEIVADEPTGRSLSVTFDGSALLDGAIASGTSVALDRCPLDAVLAITSVSGSDVVMRRADGTQQVVVFANPDDESAVRDGLASDHPERLASRYLLYLAGHFDRQDELFTRTDGILHFAGSLTDRVPPKPGRYFYRVRISDASGAVSIGGAILPMVVRVPSTMPMPKPERRNASVGAGTLSVDIALEPDPDLAWALLFYRVGDYATAPPDPAGASCCECPTAATSTPTPEYACGSPTAPFSRPSPPALSLPPPMPTGCLTCRSPPLCPMRRPGSCGRCSTGATACPATASRPARWAPTR